MPNYSYECQACKVRWDDLVTYENREMPCGEPCPHCDANEVKKIITGFPGLAADTNLTPDKKTGGQWSEMMNRVKSNIPKRFHGGIDKSTNMTGRHWKG